MKNSKKSWLIFRRIIIIFFIIYLINYYQVESGNYQEEYRNKAILTEEKIKEFENDVKKGKEIDIKKYTTNEIIDTSTITTNLAYEIGESIDELFSNKITKFFNYIGSFFK